MSVTFACYFPAENPLFITVDIKLDAWVKSLSKAIAAELKLEGQDVRPSQLRLYKVAIFFLWYTPNSPTADRYSH